MDEPKGVVEVPVGNYKQSSVWLRKGEAEASSGARSISVSAGELAVLDAGGPLTNSVSVSSEGRRLALSYQLLGHGGVYRLTKRDTKHPPEFTVYQGDKKLAAGKFEFG